MFNFHINNLKINNIFNNEPKYAAEKISEDYDETSGNIFYLFRISFLDYFTRNLRFKYGSSNKQT